MAEYKVAAEGGAPDHPPIGRHPRPAPHPGPRCYTHHNREKKRQLAASHERRVKSVYGLDDYWELYKFQGGKCAICRWATGKTRRLSVDHDHKTGEVRGLLCRPCNTILGHARDAVAFFVRGINYLQNPPYRRMRNGEPPALEEEVETAA
ncbi:endonuclease VII domain-containing protein [Streptomyces griseus]|uniref:endonuclease VII domain-containing protein n=1 Tax=Streptomyces griseus TaxID=1911 RepID=UPI0034016D5C